MSTYYHVMTLVAAPKAADLELSEQAIRVGDQVHTMVNEMPDLNNPQLYYCASWDQLSEYVIVLKDTGVIPNLNFAGWPISVAPEVNPL